nr:hypothetical protein CFP56_21651 [Quercus suber]
MARSSSFGLEREPLRDNDALQLNPDRVRGPFSWLNPTQAHFDYTPRKTETNCKFDRSTPHVQYKWTSRNNRKGRHALVVSASATDATPRPTSELPTVLHGLRRMATYYPVWDVSYLVAFSFTWGSVIWVINSFLVLLPYLYPTSVSADGVYYGGGITAFIGATVFEIGSFFLMLEAINENRAGCFGWAVEQVYRSHERLENETRRSAVEFVPDKQGCTHHHVNTKNLIGAPVHPAPAAASDPTPPGAKSWAWWPSRYELFTHYIYDLGFLACLTQTIGATIFYVSGFTALPGMYNHLSTPAKLDGAYWIPQIVGGVGFVISGALFMIETQQHWWQPAPAALGWHIGLWNLIGGVGFTLCPIFGLYTAHWAQFQASISTFWGES